MNKENDNNLNFWEKYLGYIFFVSTIVIAAIISYYLGKFIRYFETLIN